MTSEAWQCPTCFNSKNTSYDAFCTTCKRPAPEGTYLLNRTQKGDRFDRLLMLSSDSEESEDEEELEREREEKLENERREKAEADAIAKKKAEEAARIAAIKVWACKMCGLKNNLWDNIACRVCGRAKPGCEDQVKAGPKRPKHFKSEWPDSRRIARRVTVKWTMHNGKSKRDVPKNMVIFDGMGSDDKIKRLKERITEKWRIPSKDQTLTAPSFKRRLLDDMFLDELKDIVPAEEWGPSYAIFLSTFRVSKRALRERKKKSKWGNVKSHVKTHRSFNENATVKVIQHFKIRGED